ncbi:MAG TPA: tetratricopeptide repeat protein [Myxococcota bacterium]|nr:tetratricopeptide repeat protein [Myxococcota bacterium]HON24292.1 tetratricopeptide repeat protein [Myxococcota bacterium]HOS60949.1 tetratricopeptide repeat protein [Myxococcota bacterium]HPC90718.1 tetratricopeptide repeat protein [Myxococcota bacterium]HPL24093.1 tetratricopeptide repeat protein [Myxococcota bacterium]
MKLYFYLLGAALIAVMGCSKPESAGPLQKVATPAKGLPTPEAAAGGQVHSQGVQAEMPDDDVHRRAKMGAATGGAMSPVSAHGEVDSTQLDDNVMPLRLKGLGSAWELKRALKVLESAEAKAKFEEAFRLTFSANKSLRDLGKAQQIFEDMLRENPKFVQAYRGLAYVALSNNFNMVKATELYEKALEIDPNYGEVHYAMAFLYAGSDHEKGAKHLARALELDIPDENGLKNVYQIGAQ